MQDADRKLLRSIAKDIAEIKTQITNLRIRVAAISATIAIIVTLITGWLINGLALKPTLPPEPTTARVSAEPRRETATLPL